MSNYENAIGRAQAMIDAGHSAALRADVDKASILASLARVQLELASMWEPAESQPEVEVEGTDVSAELLVAALADGSLERALAVALEKSDLLIDEKWAARTAVRVVRGVLMGETPPVAERAASEEKWMADVSEPGFEASEGEAGRRTYTCGLINDDGVMCSYPRHHRDWTNPASHSWNQEKPKSRDSEPVPWPKGYEKCGVTGDYNGVCTFNKGHLDPHSWE